MSLDQMVIFKDKYWKNYGNNMGIPDSNELKLEDTLNKGNNRLCDGIVSPFSTNHQNSQAVFP